MLQHELSQVWHQDGQGLKLITSVASGKKGTAKTLVATSLALSLKDIGGYCLGQGIEVISKVPSDNVVTEAMVQGLPMVSFGQLPIEAARFAKLAAEIAQELIEYNVEVGDRTLPTDDTEWVSLAQQRFEAGQAIHRAQIVQDQANAADSIGQSLPELNIFLVG